MPTYDTFTLAGLIQYYSALLPIQFRGLPKATATMNILVKQALADFMASQLAVCFDLETAEGNQLDILAKYIGVNRNSNIPASVLLFSYANALGGGPFQGFNSVGSSTLNGYVYDSVNEIDFPTTAFTDVQFLFVLQLQIALNHFDVTFSYIQSFLEEFFPGQITCTDNLNMTLTYNVPAGLPISNAVLVNFLPRPMGVGININTTASTFTRILSDNSTIRDLSDGSTVRITA